MTFVTWSLRLFGPLADRRIVHHPDLSTKLARAGSPLVPVAFLSTVYARVAIAAGVGVAVLVAYLVLVGGPAGADPRTFTALVAAPMVAGILVYSVALLRPDLEIAARRRNLDTNLPYALNFLAAMAAAGVLPSEAFGALAKQQVYGEAAERAKGIYRDTRLFGKDLVTALRDAARRSPSRAFSELLHGAVSTVTSGGDLRAYLLAKAEQFSTENRRRQRAFLESLGVMAESYVVVAAAAPLFLLVILSVMAILRESGDPTLYLNLLVLVALPLIHGAFTGILRTLRPE